MATSKVMDPRMREDDAAKMDPRVREDDAVKMDPRMREDDAVKMDPRMREDDGKCAVIPVPYRHSCEACPRPDRGAGIHPLFPPTVKPP